MTLPLQDPLLSAEGQGQPSHRTGFFRSLLKERKAAVVGLAIIVFFVVLAIVAPCSGRSSEVFGPWLPLR